jgi:hypothetical protein
LRERPHEGYERYSEMGVQQQLTKPHQALQLHHSSQHSTRSSRSTCTNQSTNSTRSTHKEHTQGSHARSTRKGHTQGAHARGTCSTPQHTAAHRSTPQHTPHAHAARTPQHTAAHRSTPQHTERREHAPHRGHAEEDGGLEGVLQVRLEVGEGHLCWHGHHSRHQGLVRVRGGHGGGRGGGRVACR